MHARVLMLVLASYVKTSLLTFGSQLLSCNPLIHRGAFDLTLTQLFESVSLLHLRTIADISGCLQRLVV